MRALVFLLLVAGSSNLIAQAVAVEAGKRGAFFVGLDNDLTIVAEGISCDDLLVESNLGRISETDNCTYRLLLDSFGVIGLRIYQRSTGLLISERSLSVYYWPIPDVVFGHTRNDEMSYGEATAQRGIRAPIEGFDISGTFPVRNFQFSLIRNEELVGQCQNEGPVFGNAAKVLKSQLQRGDRLVFEKIMLQMPDRAEGMQAESFFIDIR